MQGSKELITMAGRRCNTGAGGSQCTAQKMNKNDREKYISEQTLSKESGIRD